MKRQFLLTGLMILSMGLFAQVSDGDVQLIQNYFGVAKIALIQEYMEFSPQQDSVFWPIYNDYEAQRKQMGKERIALVEEYLANVENITEEAAEALVEKSNALEITFKKLQKKYFLMLAKKIGPVKSAQFYQLESYLNNVVNLSIQESIPFVGDMEQMHDQMPSKKK